MSNVRTTITRLLYVALGAIAFSAVAAGAATIISTNIQTDGTLQVGGSVGIATSTPGSLLSIGGIANFTAATSTLYGSGGINLKGGCYAVNGTCVGGGGGGTTPSPLPFFGNQTNTAWVRPSLSTFSTWHNQTDAGSNVADPSTASATDNPNGLPLVIRGGTDGDTNILTGLLKPVASPPPWTITVALAGFTNVADGSPGFSPIILYDTVHDKAETFRWDASWAGPYGGAVKVEQWTGTTPGTRSVVSGNTYGFQFLDYFAWFRVTNDGVNLTYYMSPDGLLFEEIYSEPSGSFLGTVNKVGFGYDRAGSGDYISPGQVADAILWSWVETSP